MGEKANKQNKMKHRTDIDVAKRKKFSQKYRTIKLKSFLHKLELILPLHIYHLLISL